MLLHLVIDYQSKGVVDGDRVQNVDAASLGIELLSATIEHGRIASDVTNVLNLDIFRIFFESALSTIEDDVITKVLNRDTRLFLPRKQRRNLT